MTARETAILVTAAARSSLECLPATVLGVMKLYDVSLAEVARAIGNNAAQVIAIATEEES